MQRQSDNNPVTTSEITTCIQLVSKIQQKKKQAYWDQVLTKAINDDYIIPMGDIHALPLKHIVFISSLLSDLLKFAIKQRLSICITPLAFIPIAYSFLYYYFDTPIDDNIPQNWIFDAGLTLSEEKHLKQTIDKLNIGFKLSLQDLKNSLLEERNKITQNEVNSFNEASGFQEAGLFTFFCNPAKAEQGSEQNKIHSENFTMSQPG